MTKIIVKNNSIAGRNSVVYDSDGKRFIILKELPVECGLTAVPFRISNNWRKPDDAVTYKDGEKHDNLVYVGEYESLAEFWKTCALEAMQGYQETGEKAGIVFDILPKETASMSFKMADAMLERYMLRMIS